ncbi:hypothetical protein [Caulobacter sp.]|uniref:hypothetical protein n=1 Tax=Caulobacter sp. TaxID=78 RepID=UPI0031DC36CB
MSENSTKPSRQAQCGGRVETLDADGLARLQHQALAGPQVVLGCGAVRADDDLALDQHHRDLVRF